MAMTKVDGHEVRSSRVKITNAGDGLSKALKVQPVELHVGDKVYVALECEVTKLGFEPIGDTADFVRVHQLRAGTGAIVEKDAVLEAIDDYRERVIAAADDAKGQLSDPAIKPTPRKSTVVRTPRTSNRKKSVKR